MNPEQARKQIADQISRDGWGFDGVFSKRTQWEIYSDHDQELHLMSVRSDPKSLLLHKSTSNRTHIKRTHGIFTKPQENEKGETKNTKLQKFQQGYKLRFEVEERCGPDRRPFLGLNLKIKSTVEVQNRCGPLAKLEQSSDEDMSALKP
jgi:hypothetical protein